MLQPFKQIERKDIHFWLTATLAYSVPQFIHVWLLHAYFDEGIIRRLPSLPDLGFLLTWFLPIAALLMLPLLWKPVFRIALMGAVLAFLFSYAGCFIRTDGIFCMAGNELTPLLNFFFQFLPQAVIIFFLRRAIQSKTTLFGMLLGLCFSLWEFIFLIDNLYFVLSNAETRTFSNQFQGPLLSLVLFPVLLFVSYKAGKLREKLNSSFLILGLVYLCFFLNAVIFAIRNGGDLASSLLLGLIIAALITYWCVLDARNRKFHLPHAYQFLIFLIPLIGWPLYAFSSRGFIGGLKFIGLQIMIFILVSIIPILIV
jgi:hypothetical protein